MTLSRSESDALLEWLAKALKLGTAEQPTYGEGLELYAMIAERYAKAGHDVSGLTMRRKRRPVRKSRVKT